MLSRKHPADDAVLSVDHSSACTTARTSCRSSYCDDWHNAGIQTV